MRAARAWIRSLIALTGLTLLLTGCLKLDMAITISPDDTVDGELVFAVNKELLKLSGQSVEDILGNTAVPSDIEGATQEPYEDDRFVGTKVRFEDVALADMQPGAGSDSLSIERVGDTYEVSGVMDLTTDDPQLQGNPFEDQIKEAFDTAELRIAITFPGEVLETNGTVDGTTVTWEPVFGERTELTAVASASGDGVEGSDGEGSTGGTGAAGASSGDSGGTTLLLVILGLVIIAVIVGLFLVLRRRGAGTQPVPAVPEPPAIPTPPPAPPGPPDDPAE
jgi:hypothetical protein